MHFYKTFTATGLITCIWVTAGLFGSGNFSISFLAAVATFVVLNFVLREPKPDKTFLPARRTRFEAWFESLNDDQLNALRERLTDGYDEDYASVGGLMSERKAKRG